MFNLLTGEFYSHHNIIRPNPSLLNNVFNSVNTYQHLTISINMIAELSPKSLWEKKNRGIVKVGSQKTQQRETF